MSCDVEGVGMLRSRERLGRAVLLGKCIFRGLCEVVVWMDYKHDKHVSVYMYQDCKCTEDGGDGVGVFACGLESLLLATYISSFAVIVWVLSIANRRWKFFDVS